MPRRDFGPQLLQQRLNSNVGSNSNERHARAVDRPICQPIITDHAVDHLYTYVQTIHTNIFRIVEIKEYEGCAKNKGIRNVHLCMYVCVLQLYMYTYMYVSLCKHMYVLKCRRTAHYESLPDKLAHISAHGSTNGRTRRTTNRRQPDNQINNNIYIRMYILIYIYIHLMYLCAIYIEDSESWSSSVHRLCRKMDAFHAGLIVFCVQAYTI